MDDLSPSMYPVIAVKTNVKELHKGTATESSAAGIA